jgi:AcrR family transcriptional regulator
MLSKTRLDPRVERTRALLLNAFTELVNEMEPNNLSVQQITEKASINRATFYAHFRDLDDFMSYALSTSFLASLEPDLLNASTLSQANVRQLGLATYSFLSSIHHCNSGNLKAKTKLDSQLQEELYKIILSWLSSSPLNPNTLSVTPELQALSLSWSLYGLAKQKDHLIPEQSIEDALTKLLALFK